MNDFIFKFSKISKTISAFLLKIYLSFSKKKLKILQNSVLELNCKTIKN